MDNKSLRLAEIKQVIQNEHFNSQDELLKSLISKGFHLTQATLSRDLKLLKVVKMPGSDGTYRYVLPNSFNNAPNQNQKETGSLEGFLSIEFSGNAGVIKTVPAFSHTIASSIDESNIKAIAGTLAGNDTIIFVVREGFTHQQVKEQMLKEFPDLINKLL